MEPRISYEAERGCGMRKVGGLYLVSPPQPTSCGRFPIHTTVCPTCGAGIRPSRGFTWVDGNAIRDMAKVCPYQELAGDDAALLGGGPVIAEECHDCAMTMDIGRAGLIWIGTMHYPTPQAFVREGMVMGHSRRLPGNRLPRGFVIGETEVFLGHRWAVAPWSVPGYDPDMDKDNLKMEPGIFGIWRPTAAEKVVDWRYDQDEVERLGRRGIDAVIVKPAGMLNFSLQTGMEGLDGEEEVSDTEE